MQAPTQAPSQFDRHRELTRRVVAAVLAGSAATFLYAASVAGFSLLAVLGTVGPAAHYLLAAGALLLVWATALVALWQARQHPPRPLRPVAVLAVGTAAALLATGVLAGAHWLQTGEPPAGTRLGWLLAGLVALGLQLYVGALDPDAHHERVVGVEVLAGPTFVLAALVVGVGTTGSPSFLSLAPLVGVGLGLFLAVGGTLYLLGYLLVRRPPYHRIA